MKRSGLGVVLALTIISATYAEIAPQMWFGPNKIPTANEETPHGLPRVHAEDLGENDESKKASSVIVKPGMVIELIHGASDHGCSITIAQVPQGLESRTVCNKKGASTFRVIDAGDGNIGLAKNTEFKGTPMPPDDDPPYSLSQDTPFDGSCLHLTPRPFRQRIRPS